MLLKMKLLKKLILVLMILLKKTKFSADTNALDDKIDKVDKKIPDVSNLATKSSVTTSVKNLIDKIDIIDLSTLAKKASLANYMLKSTFNTKSTELQNKISANDTKITSIKTDLNGYAKKR